MILHKKTISDRLAAAERWFASLFLTELLFITCIFSGTFSNATFNTVRDGIHDSSLEFSSGLAISIEKYTGVKVYGDSIQPQYPSTIYSDVIAGLSDTFTFFYMDTTDDVYKRDIRIVNGVSTSISSSERVMDAPYVSDNYLHADKGENGYLVSVIRKGAGIRRLLRIGNGTTFIDCDSAMTTGWMFSSQCQMEKDTFLVVYSSEMSIVKLLKIYSRGSTLQIITQTTVSADISGGNQLMNCSVASDKKGGILVVWSRGSPTGIKKLNYRFYDRGLVPGQSGVLNQNIGDNSFYYYDDSPVEAIDSLKFAVVHWDSMGLMMNTLRINNGTVSTTAQRILNSPDLKFPSISKNGKYCLIACLGDVNNDNYTGIEGVRYTVQNGSLVNPDVYSFSRNVNIVPVSRYSIAVNNALDTVGNFAVTWRFQNRIQGSVWKEQGIRYKNGFWRSPVDSLSVIPGDSLRFYASTLTVSNRNSWDITGRIRVGSSVKECTTSTWISLSDNTELEKTRSLSRYFQYRIDMKRNSLGDSLGTPSVSSITIPFNVQPVIIGIDSIKIGAGIYQKYTGDTIRVLSRSDSVRLKVTISDIDSAEKLSIKTSWPGSTSAQEISGTFPATATLLLNAVSTDTAARCTVFVWDSRGWNAVPFVLNYQSKNSLPLLNVSGWVEKVGISRDSFTINGQYSIGMQETDSCIVNYTVSDPNDTGRVKGYLYVENSAGDILLDSTDNTGSGEFHIRGDTLTPSAGYWYRFVAKDNDTSVSCRMFLYVNHSPVIKEVTMHENSISPGDTVKTNIGKTEKISVAVHDTDCVFGDTLTYYLKIPGSIDSVSTNKETVDFQWKPSLSDTLIKFIVTDNNGKSDSLEFFQKFPWLEIDTVKNRGFSRALDTLTSKISLIVGSHVEDTIDLPILNNGNDTLRIESITFGNNSFKWFKLGVPYDTGMMILSGLTAGELADTLNIAPAAVKILQFKLTADSLVGDGIFVDTVHLLTNDYSHTEVIIPVRIEYNDLPQIISIQPDYSLTVPWRLNKRTMTPLLFPPHASISIQFSEPMDTTSMQNGLIIYSRRDSMATGVIEPIGMKREWRQNFTRLNCFSMYTKRSPAFSVFPPESLFIPTDILAIKFNGNISDRAITPSGPNALDVNLDCRRDLTTDDTVITMNVDSVKFNVYAISPLPSDTVVRVKPVIQLSFSSEVYSASVDRNLKGNRTLIVKSKYNNGKQLDFDSIAIDKNKVSFHIAQRLFYCDSLWCRYNSSSVKNSMGFQVDNNHDGIASAMFDTTDTADDLNWSYRIKNIHIISHQPKNDEIIKAISPAITINFDDIIDTTILDMDTSGSNRSFKLESFFEPSLSAYHSIEITDDKKTVRIQPKRKFFSRDSIYFTFNGFTKNYQYAVSRNFPGDSSENFNRYDWAFSTGNTGFYTYPNPYKPGKDPRHCSDHGPCGIWFKNLHVLKQGINDLIIKIYSMDTYPVYNSQKAGVAIHFEESSAEFLPQWLWDTRNQSGELVASGLYFYTVSDLKNKVLTKGKLMIVR
jgi:hypothetical protein